MTVGGPRPACHETIDNHDDWRAATDVDLDQRGPCRYCFPDCETTAAIDAPLSQLVTADSRSGRVVHIDADHGEPTWDPPRKQSTLAGQLAAEDVGPEDIGLDPVPGGDA